MAQAVLQHSPARALRASITPTGNARCHLLVTSFSPQARRPEERVRFSQVFAPAELLALRALIDEALLAPSVSR